MPPTSISKLGFESALPGLMSFTRIVPAKVPSLFHSSSPLTPSVAPKVNGAADIRQIVEAGATGSAADIPDANGAGLGAIAFPKLVAVVPGRQPRNIASHSRSSKKRGFEPVPAAISLTRTVPASVPSLFHSSLPLVRRSLQRKACRRRSSEKLGPNQ